MNSSTQIGIGSLLNTYKQHLDAHQLFNDNIQACLNWDYLLQVLEEQVVLHPNQITAVADRDYLHNLKQSTN